MKTPWLKGVAGIALVAGLAYNIFYGPPGAHFAFAASVLGLAYVAYVA